MKETLKLLNEALKNDMADRHSYYQLKYFLVDSEPTHQARLWQCLREMRSRRDTINSICLELEDARDRIAINQAKAEIAAEKAERACNGDKKSPEARIAAAKARMAERRSLAAEKRAGDLSKRLRNVLEEARFLVETFKQMGGTDALKDWDDPQVQKEYWDAKLGDEVRRRIVAGQGMDSTLIGTVEHLHKDAKVRGVLNAYAQSMLGLSAPGQAPLLLDAHAEEEVRREHGQDDLE